MKRADDIKASRLDWITIAIVAALALAGWLNIFSVVYDSQASPNIFDMETPSGRQFIWFGVTIVAIAVIMIMDFRFFDSFAFGVYGTVMLLLILVLLLGTVVSGSKSWFEIGPARFQPAEFAKFATALAVAKVLSKPQIKLSSLKSIATIALVVGLPMGLIILQGDTGSALVFGAFLIVFYREGLPPLLVLIGLVAAALFILTLVVGSVTLHVALGAIALLIVVYWLVTKQAAVRKVLLLAGILLVTNVEVFSVNWVVNNIMLPHQQNRVKAFINPESDPKGFGYNVMQSKIAIGSGGISGKGFLEGTQTKGEYVPEQETDFIFCTIGEEHGWLGSLLLISLFVTLLLRIVHIAERQKSKFSRVYGYGVASILFFHFLVNIGMTIGLVPVIGIPLPFFSYGGSSLLAFSILIFVLLKMDAHRMQMLVR